MRIFKLSCLKEKFEKIENLRFLVGQNFLKLENLKSLKNFEIRKCGFSNFCLKENPEDARLIFFNRTLDFERTRNFY